MNLLDTSAVSAIFNAEHAKHQAAIAFRDGIGDAALMLSISAVTLSEMTFGLEVFTKRYPSAGKQAFELVRARIVAAENLEVLPISNHVAHVHGKLRAAWAAHIAPRKLAQGKLKGIPPERWVLDWPAGVLQMTENDLWIAATALTHDLKVVTTDTDYSKLQEAVPSLNVEKL